MNTLATLNHEGRAVRVAGTSDKPLFATTDVCGCLGISNARDAVSKLADDEKGVALTDTLGGLQEISVVTEPGLYTLIMRCRNAMKPGTPAYKFRRWVTHEALPAIRKTGQYQTRQPSRLELAEMVVALEREKAELEQVHKEMLPDAQFGRELKAADALFTMTQVAKALGISAIRLTRMLFARRIIYRHGTEWVPYAKYDSKGYFRIVAHLIDIPGSGQRTYHTLKVTPTGRAFIHDLWRATMLPQP